MNRLTAPMIAFGFLTPLAFFVLVGADPMGSFVERQYEEAR